MTSQYLDILNFLKVP